MAFISSFSSISIQCNKPFATVTSISGDGFLDCFSPLHSIKSGVSER